MEEQRGPKGQTSQDAKTRSDEPEKRSRPDASIPAAHLGGARRAHAQRIVPFIGAIFRTKAIGMCVSVRMELA
jgi:hypothetical protein